MKKTVMIAAMVMLVLAKSAAACPAWECQLPLNDYSCGGSHSACTNSQPPIYDETTIYSQYIYCPYCGHEMWDCICNVVAYSGDECDYSDSYCDYTGDSVNYCDDSINYCDDSINYPDSSYNYSSCGSSCAMAHWANVRDAYGNIVGQIGTGSSVEVCGVDPSNPDRVLIYDYNTGTYGSVLSECVYGGYSWDGSGDNGYYNQYQGDDDSCYQQSDCQYDYQDAGYTDCGYTEACSYPSFAPSTNAVVRYTEVYQVVRQWEMTTRACNSTCWR